VPTGYFPVGSQRIETEPMPFNPGVPPAADGRPDLLRAGVRAAAGAGAGAVSTARRGRTALAGLAALAGLLLAGLPPAPAAAAPAATVPAATVPAAAAPAATASPLPGQQTLSAVSCPVAAMCMTVGGILQKVLSPASQVWTGTGWHVSAPPERTPDSALSAVSCPTATRCVAVGTNGDTGISFADSWNGVAWRGLPPLAVPVLATLRGISCISATSCIAVGTGRTAFAARGALAERWNGTRWTRLPTARPAGATTSTFTAISCAGPRSCLAVGQLISGVGGAPLAETWDGSTWRQVAAPAGPDTLDAVACPAAGTCLASGPGPVIAIRRAGVWAALAVPAPADAIGPAEFTGLSCATVTRCVAVGGYPIFRAALSRPVAATWTGGARWALRGIADPALELPVLAAVSCSGPARCLAVGGFPPTGRPQLISAAATWNGRAWRTRRTQPSDALASVSCIAVTRCRAVGSFIDPADSQQVMAAAWSGRAWRRTSTPLLLGALTSVSCTGPAFCLATGQTYLGQPLSAAWDGGRWRPVASPGVVTSLSCASRDFCLGINAQSVAQAWNGTRWRTVAPVAVPSGATTHEIAGVSCTRATYCLAVGAFTRDSRGAVNHMLAAVWRGTGWRVLPAPDPGPPNSARNDAFNAVACVIRSGCMAVGQDTDVRRAGHNVAAWWDGTRWRVSPVPGGFGSGPGPIDGLSGPSAVSCASASSCMAVGSYGVLPVTDLGASLAVAWNGRSWRLTRLLGPGGGITGVSCPRAGRCVAVGAAGRRTLAERWTGTAWRRLTTPGP
jgi:hypothetical protein